MKLPEKTSDKLIILGTTKSWQKAPLGESGWEVWGMNQLWNQWGEYSTRWFEIHSMSIIEREWDSYNWLPKCPIPIYMKEHYPDIPNSVAYPLDKVSKGFLRQFSSTFCYQLALAIYEKFKVIAIYGVDFSGGSLRERFIEWRGFLYWLGVAAGRGIKIELPDEKLNHRYFYGLEYWEEAKDARSQIIDAIYDCFVFDGIPHGWKKPWR